MWAVARTYGTDDLMEPVETGSLEGEREWAAKVERELQDSHGIDADLSDFGERWLSGCRPNAEWIDYLRSLRGRGLYVGMISNLMPSFEPHWRAIAPPEELFDGLVLSCEAGVRKPQPEVFELAARESGTAPADCLLVDDVESHCEAARAAGWAAVHFTEAADAIEQVERLLPAGAAS